MQKAPYVFPIVGGRKIEHLHANIEALDIALSDEQIAYLESILPFNKGFPYTYFVSNESWNFCRIVEVANVSYFQGDGSDYNTLFKTAGQFDKWPPAPAIRPRSS